MADNEYPRNGSTDGRYQQVWEPVIESVEVEPEPEPEPAYGASPYMRQGGAAQGDQGSYYQPQPNYDPKPQDHHRHGEREGRKGGSGKIFLTALVGAIVGCVIVLGGFGLYGKIFGGTTVTTSGGSTTITVSGEDTTLAEVVAQKATPSVCCIYVYTKESSQDYFGMSWGQSSSSTLTQSSLGSGVVLSSDGYVVTNYHVIEDAAALKVSVAGSEYDATVVGSDASSDIAVIKVNASGLTPIELGDSDELKIGEWVMSIGSPFGLEQSVATGIVSATSRSQIISSSSSGSSETMVYTNLIQTDAAINPGNSGGALVNSNGELIGINTLITSYSGNYSGVGFAIPVNYAVELANTIIAGKTPSHAQLGVSLVSVTSSLAQRYGLKVDSGAYVSTVSSGSAADKAGIQVGDIITKMGDTEITSSSDLMLAIRSHDPGDTVSITLNRDGQTMTLSATLSSDS